MPGVLPRVSIDTRKPALYQQSRELWIPKLVVSSPKSAGFCVHLFHWRKKRRYPPQYAEDPSPLDNSLSATTTVLADLTSPLPMPALQRVWRRAVPEHPLAQPRSRLSPATA